MTSVEASLRLELWIVTTLISELQVTDLSDAASMLSRAAGSGETPLDAAGLADLIRVNPGLSLAAREGGHVVALCLCVLEPDGGYGAKIVLAPEHGQPTILLQTLIDRALRKLAARNVHKCRIDLPVTTDQDPWFNFAWSSDAKTEAA